MHNSLAHQQASQGRGSMLSESKFRKAKQAVQPNLMYLQGQQLENEEEIGCYVIRCGGSISIRSSCSNVRNWGDPCFLAQFDLHWLERSRVKCTMLAVLCGKVGKQRTPPGPMPESQRLWPSFPFPELISSGSGGISIRGSYSYVIRAPFDLPWLERWSASLAKDRKQNKSLVPLGIACVDGTLVCSFNRQGVGPLLFFCTNQDEDEDIENDLYSDLPRWSASLEKDRVKGRIGSKPARQIGYKGSDNVEWGKGGVDAKVGDYSLAHEHYESSSSSSPSRRGRDREKGKRARDISTATALASAAVAMVQRLRICGVLCSTMPHFPSGSRVKCTMLAVLCGKVGKQRMPPDPVPESQRPRPSFPFPELISSGRLDVHTLINPTVDQFLEAQRALQPRFMYFQGQQLDKEEEIGRLVWGDADVSDPQIFSSLICPPFPTIVYLEVPSGEKIAQSLQSKGISYIMYWRYSLSSYAASHFRHSLMSVVPSSCSHAWDAFQLAYTSFEQYCVRNNEVQRLMLGPHLLGDAPRIYITPPGNKMAEEEDTSEYFPDIKIYDEDVHLKLLICGAHCTPDSSILNSLEDGLNALLNIELVSAHNISLCSAAPPLHVDSTLLDGVVTICCDITTSSSSHVSLLLSGSPQTCFDDKLLEKHIKKELIESRRLVRVVSVSEDDRPSSAEPLTSMSVASGASTFEVLMTLPKWAAQVLKYLAQETSYKSLVPLGIASVNGTPVSSFDRQDVDRLLFFCTNQDEDEAIANGLYHHPPRWSASLAKDRVKGNMVSKPVLYSLSTVYLEVPAGEKLAQSLQLKGIPYVLYWRNSFSSYAASHFRQALISVVQSSCSHTWDAFQLAQASFRLYCARNNDAQSVKLGPRLLGDAPKINIFLPENEMVEEEGSSEHFPAIKIYDEDVNMKLLICGAPCILDASLLGSLEDGLNALLNIEIRGCRLQNRVSAAPPPLHAETLPHGVVTMRCDITTCSSSHVSLLVSGSPQTCFDDKLLENHIKKEIVEKGQLVRAVLVREDDKPSSVEPLTSISVASGASTFEVWMTLPKWAGQVLKYLAQETSYKSLVPLGIACVNGTPVSSFDRQDVDRLLFFCKNEAIVNGLYSHLPRWSASLVKDRLKGTPESKSSTFSANGVGEYQKHPMKGTSLLVKPKLKSAKMRPIPHSSKRQMHPFVGIPPSFIHDASQVKPSLPAPPVRHNALPVAPTTQRKLSSGTSRVEPAVPLNPLPMKKHGCDRLPIGICSEEDFLKDVMQFLLQRGHTRLVPQGGLAEFPDAVLNAKRLDLYNLYKEVVSRGGFYVGNGINWKGQVFSKMSNHTVTNKMTGVGNTLKRHYETYLLEYELSHDDVGGECCLLCHSSAPGDWVNCGLCGEWAHFGCDRRQGLGTFKDYAKTDGLEYICPHCSLANYKKKPPPPESANGFRIASAQRNI
uniref:ARID domain-containing protein n=1 Tax=Oryza nivara TaxID=4536 RepID=A0A0E0ICR8_ORYNI